jgi:hypothetical protein
VVLIGRDDCESQKIRRKMGIIMDLNKKNSAGCSGTTAVTPHLSLRGTEQNTEFY